MAVQPGRVQHTLAYLPGDIRVVLEHDFILRQRPGFVGTQDVHRAKVLDSVEMFHDDFLLRQFDRPARQRGGNDHRQHFRR
ncbi:hypothetical protein D3C80_1184820 [compost metagenome]